MEKKKFLLVNVFMLSMKIDTSVWEVKKMWIICICENSCMNLLHKMIDFLATEVLFKDNVKGILICAKHFSPIQKRLLISSAQKKKCYCSFLFTDDLSIWFLLLSLDNFYF